MTLDARRRFGADADPEGLFVDRRLDMDGDGVGDPLVSHKMFCGTGGCAWQLYVARGACGHFVAELFGVWPTPSGGVHRGLLDLTVGARAGCAGMQRDETRFWFDGTRYVAHERRTCHCPLDEGSDVEGPSPVDPEAACDPWRATTAPRVRSAPSEATHRP